MSSLRKLAPDVTGYATAERAALAHAIAAHAAAAAHVRATDEAGQRASEAVYSAQETVTAAQEGVAAAREAMVNHMVAAAGGNAGPAPQTEREARVILTDAEAALDASRAARDALKGRLPKAEEARDRAARVRSEAARAVIAAEAADHAAALAGEVDELQATALRKGAALAWLLKVGALPAVQQVGAMFGKPADPRIRAIVGRHEEALQEYSYDGWNRTTAAGGATAWDTALTALEHDASAPLPV